MVRATISNNQFEVRKKITFLVSFDSINCRERRNIHYNDIIKLKSNYVGTSEMCAGCSKLGFFSN